MNSIKDVSLCHVCAAPFSYIEGYWQPEARADDAEYRWYCSPECAGEGMLGEVMQDLWRLWRLGGAGHE